MKTNSEKIFIKRKLKNYLVNRHEQLRVVLITLIHMSLFAVVVMAVVLYPLIKDIYLTDDLNIQYRASQAFLTIINRLTPAVIIIFILASSHLIIITHRIWGPLVNFTSTIKKIGTGDFTRKVFLRKKDYLKEESKHVNNMIDGLTQIVSNLRNDHLRLAAAVEEFSASLVNSPEKKIAHESLKNIQSQVQLLSKDISQFKL